ncbi:hypothetical protein JCM5350_003995 [Sporobolomyces pararoseus]
MTRNHDREEELGYTSSDSASSEDEDQAKPFRSKHGSSAKPSSSLKLWIIGAVVVVVLAVIGATVFVLTRDGGSSSTTSSGSASVTSTPGTKELALTPSSFSVGEKGTEAGGAGNNREGNEESRGRVELGDQEEEGEEETCEDCEDTTGSEKPRPTKPQAGSSPSSTKAASSSTNNPSPTGGSSSPSSSLAPLYGEDLNLDFTSLTSNDQLEPYLDENRIRISTYGTVRTIGPILHGFYRENVDWVDGSLRLLVRGQTGDGEVSSGEFETQDKMLYGRVTTRMKASPVPGVCHGIFWYGSPTLEVDIELLSSYYTEGRGDSVRPGVQLTNHPTESTEGKMENMVVPYGFDPTEDFHDYTIEWKAGETIFEVDGKEIGRMQVNVPRDPMKFIWNSWSSGEINWSAGPPTEDSEMLISRIVANWTVVEREND